MSFFRFGIPPDNLPKHVLQISVLHTSLMVTLTVAITWPDQYIAVFTSSGSNNNSQLLGMYDICSSLCVLSQHR